MGMRRLAVCAVVLGVVGAGASAAQAGSISLWREAVATGDEVRVVDLCRLSDMSPAERAQLEVLVVAPAPVVGGSSLVTVKHLRAALRSGGVNTANVVIKGSAQCSVTRPKASAELSARTPKESRESPAGNTPAESQTLRESIVEFVRADVAVPNARVEVQFGRNTDGVLDLTTPAYTFEITRSSRRRLGMVGLDVAIFADGEFAQRVPVLVNVSFTKPVVVAARAVNVGAIVETAHVQVVEMSFTELDRAGADDPATVIGQRAKRFIPPGAVVRQRDLEAVPLVKRGQVVTVQSIVGGVSIVTAGKAMTDGIFGDAIELRTDARGKRTLTATVTGPGRVRIGSPTEDVVAMGGGR